MPKDTTKTYYARTSDGWRIAVDRYIASAHQDDKTPIVLCHGMHYNSHFWDLSNKLSLAQFLSRRGYDVWLVSLRGSGKSQKPALSLIHSLTKPEISQLNNAFIPSTYDPRKFNWNIDDYIHKDLPAAIDLVKRLAKKEGVTWIGHSLGGMVIYGYIETERPSDIKNLVAIASPIIIPQPPNDILRNFAAQQVLMYPALLVNMKIAAQIGAPIAGRAGNAFDILFYNRENMKPHVLSKMLANCVEDISLGAFNQIRLMIKTGKFMSADGRYSYTDNIGKINCPVLFIAGTRDYLAPPESMRFAYDRITSPDKEFREFGITNGYSADYGHSDLILGRESQDEVYTYIYRWLEAHSR